ncbi:MAG: RluA family pseudouridine synthase [Planctomycetota bacterium]|nr:RluA family pseudouridine synthase [Planctomycetota bacterium]
MTSPLEPAERPADDRRLARVPGHLAGARLDRFLAEHFPSWSRRQLMDAIREGHVKVNGRKARPGQRVEAGDELDLPVWSKHFADVDKRPRRSGPDMRATSEVRVLHRDETLLVVDKPAGMAVHGGAGPGRATILDALRDQILEGYGLVHRLDRDTTGVLILCRGEERRRQLIAAFAERGRIVKTYEAITSGAPEEDQGVIDAPLRAPPRGGRAEVDPRRGRPARTRFAVVERFTRAARLRVELDSGRTHQIRAHLRHMGYPLLVDPLYGGRRALRIRDPRDGRDLHLTRTPLHAARLELDHPATGERVAFEAPLPADLKAVLEVLRVITGRGSTRGGLPPPPLPGEPPRRGGGRRSHPEEE